MDMNPHNASRRTRLGRGMVAVLAIALLLPDAVGGTLGVRAVTRADAPPASAPAKAEKAEVDNGIWAFAFAEFFGPGTTLNVYPSRRGGKWVSALGSSRKPGTSADTWNSARHVADVSGLKVEGDAVRGPIVVHLTPDPWVPAHQQVRTVTIDVDARLTDPVPPAKPTGKSAGKPSLRSIKGTYKAKLPDGVLEQGKGKAADVAGAISGSVGARTVPEPTALTYNLVFEGLNPGGKPTDNQRRVGVVLGVRDGEVVNAQAGAVGMTNAPYGLIPFDPPTGLEIARDGFKGNIPVPFTTLDGDAVTLSLEVMGDRVSGLAAGTYAATFTGEDGKVVRREGQFWGTVADGVVPDVAFEKGTRPWFVPAAGREPAKPGEHPRLFFRKSDLPELRRRAETPEGKQILACLRARLGGGEAMPTSMNPSRKAYSKNGFKPVEGSYTISTAAGFGFLYQLTGNAKYAALARQCVEIAWAGQRGEDDRYAWVGPGGELRAGPTLGWYAVAYDLCYDAWPEDFRVKFARAVQDYKNPDADDPESEGVSLRKMALTPRLGPNSNHYGAVAGGAGLAVLAIKGDPGTDGELLGRYDRALQRGVSRAVGGQGFGDGGFFNEGHGPGQIFSDTAFVPYIQALRVAEARDYVNAGRPNVANITMLRVWELIGPPAVYPYRSAMKSGYGAAEFYEHRAGLSRGGQFCQGFGAVRDQDKPLMLWTFNHVVEPDPARRTFDTVSPYPHRPMLALINWPFGMAERNPAEALPPVHRDKDYEYFVFRNRWQDENDTVVTTLLNPPPNELHPREVMVWGLRQRRLLASPAPGRMTVLQAGRDRSAVLANANGSLAVDFSKASGADALVVVGPLAANTKPPQTGATSDMAQVGTYATPRGTFQVLTLSASGKHPEVKVDGDALVAGGQRVTFDGKKLVLGTFTAAEAGKEAQAPGAP